MRQHFLVPDVITYTAVIVHAERMCRKPFAPRGDATARTPARCDQCMQKEPGGMRALQLFEEMYWRGLNSM